MSAATGRTALDLLELLVGFDTESGVSNLRLIEAVESYLGELGVPSVRVPNADGSKAALFATVGPRDRGGVVLSGHTDCVPVAGQDWTGDPFRLRLREGRAIGRGAVDMKGFDALALAALPEALRAGLKTPIHILLSYDEETTCLGANGVIARFGHDLPRPVAAIVGEPTELRVVDAHKSVATFVTRVHGFAAHSAKPHLGASAVMAAGDLVAALNGIADDLERRGDPSGRFDPAFSTVHVGILQGGRARNILAEECFISWEFRALPDLDPDEVPTRFAAATAAVLRDRLNRYGPFGRIATMREVLVPGLRPDPGSPAERLALDLTGTAETTTAPFATEAGHFQAAGIPTVVCGPGSINQAHQPDEYITLDALAAGERFMQRLIARCAAD
ncbi:acetylornithine deacetylase [Enterovirga sp.]|uniref:acetylornithine deacetylase n=1 Tax=Enterovirga sp. TaxID=2026350 RepID=UPI002622DCFB|nr:acetylornithine deacetylase [Enterovirga sp.]MDB5591391.1 acetylornithine deacetylase [Enterovirga sp.]